MRVPPAILVLPFAMLVLVGCSTAGSFESLVLDAAETLHDGTTRLVESFESDEGVEGEPAKQSEATEEPSAPDPSRPSAEPPKQDKAAPVVVLSTVKPASPPGRRVAEPRFDAEGSRRTVRDWSGLDAAVAGVPAPESIGRLAEALDAFAVDDWDRVRAVYTWLTHNIAYDTESFFSGQRSLTSPEDVFRTRAAVCQGYAELFVRLARELDLDARLVSGYAKGYSYRAGERFTSTNHAWNAVLIAGSWHLFDATWGAGHVDGRSFVRDPSGYYFDTPPELFLRSHFPEEPVWQLSESPVTLRDYEAESFVPSYVYESLWDMGFGDEAIAESIRTATDLPKAYGTQGHHARVVAAPLREFLQAGVPVDFRLQIAPPAEAAVIMNGRFVYMEREGEMLSVRVTPERGELKVSVRYAGSTRSFWTLLEYGVR